MQKICNSFALRRTVLDHVGAIFGWSRLSLGTNSGNQDGMVFGLLQLH